ncbi:MAG: hypothetical protein HY332_07925 [Chloroflexi bacterium]|nr:hypothetical protein [Chloroflexota bacterium]
MGSMEGREWNVQVYAQAREQLAQYRGQYVTVRHGRIVAISPTFDEAFRLAEGDPDALVLQIGAEPVREPARLGSRTWR